MNKDEVIALAKPFSGLSLDGLNQLYDLAAGVKVEGAVVECGVCSGGSAAVLWAAAGTERKLWLFDSFEGMPYPTEKDGGRAYAQYNHRMTAYGSWNKGSMLAVKDLMGKVDPEGYITLVKGWVEDTLPVQTEKIGPIAVLHLDMDFYSPTRTALEHLYPRVLPGGLVIIDDYQAWQGCRTAVDEYMDTCKLRFIDGTHCLAGKAK